MTDKPEISVRLIRLADGTLIDPLTRQPVVPITADTSDSGVEGDGDVEATALPSQPHTIAPLSRRSILDLTLNPQQMAVINNVLVYTLWGLPDDEIAMQCNCTPDEVSIVRDLEEYNRMHDALVAGVNAAYTASAHGVIAQSAVKAARIVVRALDDSSKAMRMEAAKDILDRSGHRPTDHASVVIAMGKGADDHLVIRVVRESERPHIPEMQVHNGS